MQGLFSFYIEKYLRIICCTLNDSLDKKRDYKRLSISGFAMCLMLER